MKIDKNKINNVVLYLSEMAILWCRRKESEIRKGLFTVDTWEQFQMEFKMTFFPNYVIYEAKASLRS